MCATQTELGFLKIKHVINELKHHNLVTPYMVLYAHCMNHAMMPDCQLNLSVRISVNHNIKFSMR